MHVYFSGIGGVGIGPLAMLALDAGYKVSGSDVVETPMTRELTARGVNIPIVDDDSHIAASHEGTPIDWFVHTSAWSEDHPEIVYATSNALKKSKRAEFLNLILKENHLKLLAVAGTHGKTTTTGMLVWLLKELGIPVSYSVGTTISFGAAAQYQAGSEYFIYECDEFDKNFLEFKPELSVLPSIDYDHPDTYPKQSDYSDAFVQFIGQSRYSVLWSSDADRINLSDSPSIEILDESKVALSQVKLAGAHTRRNAWLALSAVKRIFPEISESKIIQALSDFPGTARRFEKIANNLYTDYAHHPVEIAATIEMAQEINPNVVVIYQPHQNIRQHEIMAEGGYKSSFGGARKVYWLPTYLSREDPKLVTISANELSESVATGTFIEVSDLNDQLAESIRAHQANGDLVLAMSAGSLDGWLRSNFTL